ncbi:MAG: carbohydrate-binding family 9-like protein [Bacteroidaceae bacterium]|nr:carbohydrate-binding family 9-like protein [Bacteroidaceae bacterium]
MVGCSSNTQTTKHEGHVEGNIFETYARFLTEPYGYVAHKAAGEIKVDGVLDEADWQSAPYTEAFADISGEGFPTPRFQTKAKMLWDDHYLYIGAELEEPCIWADLLQRDTIVYYNHDFEVFIDPDGDGQNYFEIETNARETVFDLMIQKPYRARTRAFVTFAWDAPGLKLKTHLNGTMNNPKDEDKKQKQTIFHGTAP